MQEVKREREKEGEGGRDRNNSTLNANKHKNSNKEITIFLPVCHFETIVTIVHHRGCRFRQR